MEIKINLDFEKWEKDISEVKSKVLNIKAFLPNKFIIKTFLFFPIRQY